MLVIRRLQVFPQLVGRRAFLEDDIDEFLAHLITIEAALGLPEDHDRRTRQELRGKDPGSTDRLKWRVGGLLHDDAASRTLQRPYRRRSDFIHGNQMDPIAGSECRGPEPRRSLRDRYSPPCKFGFLYDILLRGHQLDSEVA